MGRFLFCFCVLLDNHGGERGIQQAKGGDRVATAVGDIFRARAGIGIGVGVGMGMGKVVLVHCLRSVVFGLFHRRPSHCIPAKLGRGEASLVRRATNAY